MRTLIGSLAAAAALAAVTSCGDSTSATGRLNVQLTDAPFPFSQVSRVDVFVVRIDAKQATTDSAGAGDASDMGGWTTIATPNKSINLLSLNGGVTTNLGTGTLSTGTYQGFRMIIDPNQSSITLTDGTHPSIKWPSAAQTGIKINLDSPIAVTADSSVMTLDFDIGRSFVMRGNSISQNGLLFKPVIRAIATELTGTVSGSVHTDTPTGAAVAGATIEILKSGTTLTDTVSANVVRTTSSDATGNFTMRWLLPGSYVLRTTPPATMTGYIANLLAGGVTVTSGTTTTVTIAVTK